MTDRQEGSLYTTIDKQLAITTFGHPNANSFPLELLRRLTKEIDMLSENKDVSIILLRSEGDRAFCAGASFDELLAVSNEAEGKRLVHIR